MTSWLKIRKPTTVLLEQRPEEQELLGGGEGKLGGDVANGYLGAPAKWVSTNLILTRFG